MKIIITAGGTYGHIAPALSLISSLKKKSMAEVIFVSPNRELKESLFKQNIRTYFISNSKIKSASIFSFMQSLIRLISAIGACFYILLKIRPQIVVGFGGYAAFPLVISACILRIPTAIHEQNVVMGKANLFLSYFVRRVLLTFKETKRPFNSSKAIVIGNPIRQELKPVDKKEALRYLGLNEELCTILVMGGSQGSHKINEKFIEAIMQIRNKSLQVIHLAGKDDFEFVSQSYDKLDLSKNKLHLKNRVFSFSDEMSYLLSAADLIISRAGASTISEISYFKIPSILVPYPYAGGHQIENAKILAQSNKAVMIEDRNLEDSVLARYLDNFIGHPEELIKMREQFNTQPAFSKENNLNPADRLVEEVLKLKSRN